VARLNLSLTAGQRDKFLDFCKKKAEELGDRPCFVYRKLMFSFNLLLSAGVSLEEIRSGVDLLLDLQERDISYVELRERILEVVDLMRGQHHEK
jgi:hypothetical protein